ncbi:hypothetical protein PHYBLDRAFT_170825 [Phycomyces blakesleeanus NRRL 1555(-)]|uniref:Uncharacterized protein n=1 Tax=Phycomyces blakesleeanus (strain ATCC 8743b / DSM 1359 / FGSC 10004 / NBRC 33097 / NRRL 1555) TaxID=763407 RepID=A0A167LMA5_PHYB8|nr:hypothetical protein PHYBLDRAFT_170825 [Phycomyces blakesleeanus NRRL 1555(-)]OAD70734.1 hypothetical protein PHYBLDRAFT_170825 [Phycomyces blakesleeanus NRRL 1555(-)]|eukprot:XP_018288774.1 hypothetical protein PHYBLDRAFT_170825 [Phycomyces blakesleeanus NRRL 1555(-)]
MSSIEPLITAIVNYCRVLDEASTPRVKLWNHSFLEKCSEWCLFIETELMIHSKDTREKCYQLASKKIEYVPSLLHLLDAQHQLYKTLLINEHVTLDLYYFIMKTYDFLNAAGQPRPDILTKYIKNAV